MNPKKPRVLVVEDDYDYVEFLTKIVKGAGGADRIFDKADPRYAKEKLEQAVLKLVRGY